MTAHRPSDALARATQMAHERRPSPSTRIISSKPSRLDNIEVRTLMALREIGWDVTRRDGINYEDLLRRYMNHVGEWEGVAFIPRRGNPNFTDDEITALEQLNEETA